MENIILIGGMPRDILLGTEVKDIDITLNLRELTKIQLNHLRKYHSKEIYQSSHCKCAYWHIISSNMRSSNCNTKSSSLRIQKQKKEMN